MSRWNLIGLVTLCFLVVGCEYYPLYGTDSAQETYLNQTDITVSGNLAPEKLASVLRDQFGKPIGNVSHHLKVDFVISDEGGPIQGSGGVYQYIVIGKAKIDLFDLTRGELIYSDTINERARWTSSEDKQILANLEARDDALNRLRRMISDRIYTRVLAIQPEPDGQ